ncbi:MAG: SIS domain-containing protein [Planctomycetes bacterium]|nr:SIS domain-containing protein [Planctomycetota bacterium]
MSGNRNKTELFSVIHRRQQFIADLLARMEESAADELIRAILGANRVFVSGKGRSGLVARCFAMRLMQMGFDAHVPGEATCPRIGAGDLMIAVSCSGTTMTTVTFARISRDSAARVVAVTAAEDSALAQNADQLVLIPTSSENVKSGYRYVIGPRNNTLFEETLLLYFDAVVDAILESEDIPEAALQRRHTNLE